jgi:hypothetical protein
LRKFRVTLSRWRRVEGANSFKEFGRAATTLGLSSEQRLTPSSQHVASKTASAAR